MFHMTELHVIDGERPETLTEVVAKRLRGQLAERRIKHNEVQELTGWGKTTVWRKVNGKSPLDTDDLDKLWRLFRISPLQLLTGQPGRGPEGGPGGTVHQPPGCLPRVPRPAQVLQLRPTG
jgi:hypothetical protein